MEIKLNEKEINTFMQDLQEIPAKYSLRMIDIIRGKIQQESLKKEDKQESKKK